MKKYAYVTNTDTNDLSVIDLEQQLEVGRIPVGGSPRGGMAIDNKGIYGYVSNCAGNTVSVIDLLTNKETGKIETGVAPRGVVLSPNNEYMFVSNSGSNDVSIIELHTRKELGRIPVGDNPRALSITPDGQYVNVPCWGADSLSIIQLDNESITKSREIARIALGQDAKPYHAYSDADSQHVYTANTHKNSISIVDILNKSVIKEVKVGFGPRAVISDPKDAFLYASCEGSNAISIIDKHTWEEVQQVPVGPTPRGLKVDKSTDTIYVSSFSRVGLGFSEPEMHSLAVVDLKQRKKVGNIKTGLGPCSINIFDPAILFANIEKEESPAIEI